MHVPSSGKQGGAWQDPSGSGFNWRLELGPACFDCGVHMPIAIEMIAARVYSAAGIEAGMDGTIEVEFCEQCWGARLGNYGQWPGVDPAFSKMPMLIPDPAPATPRMPRPGEMPRWPSRDSDFGYAVRICNICQHEWTAPDPHWIVLVQDPRPDKAPEAFIKHRTCEPCYRKLTGQAHAMLTPGVMPPPPDPLVRVSDINQHRKIDLVPIASRAMSDVENERFAQNVQWGGPDHDDKHDQIDWIWFVDKFVERARRGDRWRDSMIKIAALAVAAVESFDRKERAATVKNATGVENEAIGHDGKPEPERETIVLTAHGTVHPVSGHTVSCKPTRCARHCPSPTTIVSASGESDARRRDDPFGRPTST